MPANQTAPIGPSYITITVVDNEAEARNAFVQPGMSAWYLNRHEDVLYVKTGNTYPNPGVFRIFDMKERVVKEPEYITVESFEKFKQEILDAITAPKKEA